MQEEMSLDLREIFIMFKKRTKLIVAITLATTILSAIISFFILTPVYQSEVSVVIGKNSSSEMGTSYEYNEMMMYQKLVKTYAEIAKLDSVAEATIEKANLDMTPEELKETIQVSPQAETQILDITVKSKDSTEAKVIADVFTEEFIRKSKTVIQGGEVTILESAKFPEKPIKPNKKLNVIIAFALGFMVSMVIVFLLEYLDNTIKNDEDVTKFLDVPVIGIIPDHE